MKKFIITLLSIFLTLPMVAFASPVNVDRLGNNHIEPLVKTDYFQAAYIKGTSTTATSTFFNASTTNFAIKGKLFDANNLPGVSGQVLQTTGSGVNWTNNSITAQGDDCTIQFNHATVLDGQINLCWDYVNQRLGVMTYQPRVGIHYKPGDSLINPDLSHYYETAHFPVIFEGDASHRTYLSVVDTLDSTQNDALLDMKTINPSDSDDFDDYVMGRTGRGGCFRLGYTENQPNPHVAISAPYMTVCPLGKVGIGTTDPKASLHVLTGTAGSMGFPYESSVFENSGDNKVGVFTSGSFGGGASMALGYSNAQDGTGNNPGFEIQDYAGTGNNTLRFNSLERDPVTGIVVASANEILIDGTNHRVGINQSVPSYPLDVTGDVNSTGCYRVSGTCLTSGNSTFTIGNGVIYNATTSDLVGIGTTTPSQKLDVGGSINISSSTASYFYNGSKIANGQPSSRNYFLGNSGNLTMSGIDNFSAAYQALNSNTSGAENTAIGNYAEFTGSSGGSNTCVGDSCLYFNSGGTRNTAIGESALQKVLGSRNIGIGYFAGRYETGSDAFYVDNRDRTDTTGDQTKAILYGVMAATPNVQTLTVNAAQMVSQSLTVQGKTNLATTTVAQLNFASSSAITPVFGDMFNDGVTNQLAYSNGNTLYNGSHLYTATSTVTLASTTALTAFSPSKIGTTTIAANSLKIGQHFTEWGAGYYSTPLGNTATVTVTPSIASTTSVNISTVTTGIFPASATNLPFDFRLNCTVQAIGTLAKIVCDGTFNYATALTGVSPTSNSLSTTGQITFDSTVNQTLNIKVAWSAVTTQSATVQEAWIDF